MRVATLCGLGLVFSTAGLFADIVTGEWEIAVNYLGDTNYHRLILKAEDGKVSGTLLNVLKVEGTATNESLTFIAKRPNGTPFADFVGQARGDTLEGTGHWQGQRKITWSARRTVTPPPAPRIHDFEPTEFHRFFSDAVRPALRIFPGDTVRTWTVDSGGFDSKGVQHCPAATRKPGLFTSRALYLAIRWQ